MKTKPLRVALLGFGTVGGSVAKILVERGVDWSSFRGFDRKVVILRDPRGQLVSFLLYAVYNHPKPLTTVEANGLLALLARKEADSRAVPLSRISEAIEQITEWDHRAVLRERYALCCRHLENDPDFFRIRYEDFVEGRTDGVAAYLGVPQLPRVAVPSSRRRVERTRGAGDWRNWFTREDVAYFRHDLGDAMRAFGIEDTWDLPSDPVVAPEHGSEYVRLIHGPSMPA